MAFFPKLWFFGRSELPLDSKPPIAAKKEWKLNVLKAASPSLRFEQSAESRSRAQSEEITCKASGRPRPKFTKKSPTGLQVLQKPDEKQLQAEFEASHQVLNHIQSAIVQRLNAYGVVLGVMAILTFVTILQPPGSFDGSGNIRSPVLVGCFVFFSTLSFFFSCTGLFGVWVGLVSLFRPAFFLKFQSVLPSSPNKRNSGSQSRRSSRVDKSSESISPDQLLWNDEDTKNMSRLARLLWDNLERVWRLRIYVIVSLVSCISAFGCGAFAIMATERRNLYLLIGAIVIGLLAMVVEVVKTLVGISTYHKPEWLPSSKWHHILGQVNPGIEKLAANTPGRRLVHWLEEKTHSKKHTSPSNLEPSNLGQSNLGPSHLGPSIP